MKIFIGFDRNESAAYWILERSIKSRTELPLDIRPLDVQHLRLAGLYWRADDPLASTEFTYSRFLVPYLCDYKGWALFMDSDMLCRSDIGDLLSLRDERYAAMCVKHDYRPRETEKMGGKVQTVYPRKNWSSLVLYNCGHPSNKALNPAAVNTRSGAYLHQFQWLPDESLGSLPEEWNWLEGWSEGKPKIVHYTRGIPGIHEDTENMAFAGEYLAEARQTIRRSHAADACFA